MQHKDYHLTAPEITHAIRVGVLPAPNCLADTLTPQNGDLIFEIKTQNPTIEIYAAKKRTNIFTTKYNVTIKNPDGVLKTVGAAENEFMASDAVAIFDALHLESLKYGR